MVNRKILPAPSKHGLEPFPVADDTSSSKKRRTGNVVACDKCRKSKVAVCASYSQAFDMQNIVLTYLDSPSYSATETAQLVHDAVENPLYAIIPRRMKMKPDVKPCNASWPSCRADFSDTKMFCTIFNPCRIEKLLRPFNGSKQLLMSRAYWIQ